MADRQRVLQTLGLAFDGYTETVRNLSEGLMVGSILYRRLFGNLTALTVL